AAPGSQLLRRYADGQPVELVIQLNLAAQPAVRAAVDHAVEHAVFLGVGRGQLLEPLRLDVDVTGRARARAAAFGDNALDGVVHGRFHNGRAGLGLDLTYRAVRLNVGHFGHGLRLAAWA